MATFKSSVLSQLQAELPAMGQAKRAAGAHAYMKGIAPFLGGATPERRSFVREMCKELSPPSSDELGKTARALWKLEHREYQYATNDVISIFAKQCDKSFLADHVEHLITHKSWWDTVDGLGGVAVSPLTVKYPLISLMRKWNKSDNMWLNRAAIQHQRGRKFDTDIPLLFEFCDYHSDRNEFFIAKAIGWALRDLSRIDNSAVKRFLKDHPNLNWVAVREAKKLGFK
ncbi:unannotated protein [freshwater metagenome]|uniref:Unannotated protein n=1 Tax=freshwater metagenome TaxID=449393 RepID=A0A6J7B9R3_9ZZZZ|nr:DNA alkylation repair protein [Actinomycetota bacterium]